MNGKLIYVGIVLVWLIRTLLRTSPRFNTSMQQEYYVRMVCTFVSNRLFPLYKMTTITIYYNVLVEDLNEYIT